MCRTDLGLEGGHLLLHAPLALLLLLQHLPQVVLLILQLAQPRVHRQLLPGLLLKQLLHTQTQLG